MSYNYKETNPLLYGVPVGKTHIQWITEIIQKEIESVNGVTETLMQKRNTLTERTGIHDRLKNADVILYLTREQELPMLTSASEKKTLTDLLTLLERALDSRRTMFNKVYRPHRITLRLSKDVK